jgi:hypothetical protein
MQPFEPPQTSVPSPFGPPPHTSVPSPFGPPQRPVKPPASKARWLAIPAVILLGGATLYGCFVGIDVQAEPGDRDLVLTVEDVTKGMEFTKDPAKESLKRTYYIDGSREIVYEYDGSEGNLPVYVSSQITRTSSRSDAGNEYLGMKLGASAVFSMLGENITEVPRDDLLKWGDKSTSMLLTVPQGSVGNVFVAQRGDKVFMIIVTGVFFDDKKAIEETFLPKLTRGASSSL